MMKRSALALTALLWTPVPADSAPLLEIERDGSGPKIIFTGTLEAADSPDGPWTELTGAASPFTEGAAARQRYYRARETGVASFFASASVAELTLAGPLQENFDRAYAGLPDGIFPPVRIKEYFPAELSAGGFHLPVSARVRGNSSLQECPFPKLKFKVAKENRPGTPFADAREVKIGAHCAEGGRGNIGRLRDERAAWREALAYETMSLLGFVSPRVRRAIIEYHDTGAPDESGASGWTLKRHAFLADDIEVVAQRLGARALTDAEAAALKEPAFDPQTVAGLLLLHALLGNWDFALPSGGAGLWNTEVIELPDRSLLPVAGDFDLASWVTGSVRSSAPTGYRPGLGAVEREAFYIIEDIQRRLPEAVFAAARERFLEKRAPLEALVENAEVDPEGRANAVRHLAAFYDALAQTGAR